MAREPIQHRRTLASNGRLTGAVSRAPPAARNVGPKGIPDLFDWEMSIVRRDEVKANIIAQWNRAALGALREKKEMLKAKLLQVEQRVEELEAVKGRLENSVELQEIEIQDQKESLLSELEIAAQEIKAWEARESDMQGKLEEMKKELQATRTQALEERVSKDQLQSRIKVLEAQQMSLQDKFMRSSERTRSLLVSQAAATKMKNDLQVRLARAEEQIAALKEYNNCLEDLNDELEMKLDAKLNAYAREPKAQHSLQRTLSLGTEVESQVHEISSLTTTPLQGSAIPSSTEEESLAEAVSLAPEEGAATTDSKT